MHRHVGGRALVYSLYSVDFTLAASIYCKITDTEYVHRVMCPFTPQLSLTLVQSTHNRLSYTCGG